MGEETKERRTGGQGVVLFQTLINKGSLWYTTMFTLPCSR